MDPIYEAFQQTRNDHQVANGSDINYASNFCLQMFFLCKRALTNLVRNPQATVLQVFSVILKIHLVQNKEISLGSTYVSWQAFCFKWVNDYFDELQQ